MTIDTYTFTKKARDIASKYPPVPVEPGGEVLPLLFRQLMNATPEDFDIDPGGDWATFLALASMLQDDYSFTVTFTLDELTKRVNLIILAAHFQQGIEPNTALLARASGREPPN